MSGLFGGLFGGGRAPVFQSVAPPAPTVSSAPSIDDVAGGTVEQRATGETRRKKQAQGQGLISLQSNTQRPTILNL